MFKSIETSKKRFDSNQPTQRHKCAEEFEANSEDNRSDLSNDTEK